MKTKGLIRNVIGLENAMRTISSPFKVIADTKPIFLLAYLGKELARLKQR